MKFESVTENHFIKINALTAKLTAEDTRFSAVNILAWQKFLKPEVYISESFAVLRLSVDGEFYYLPPLSESKESFASAVEKLENIGVKKFMLCADWQKDLLVNRGYTAEENRNMAEYLYITADLSELKGKKYHAKRNYINAFPASYIYREYKNEDYEAVMNLFDKCYATKTSEGGEIFAELGASWSYIKDELKMSDFDLEKQVVQSILKDTTGVFNTVQDIIEINGEISAFTLGGITPSNVGAIYFQKCDTAYRGIYALMDNLFIKNRFPRTEYINKQEDMGIEGIRKSKLSYHPVRLLNAYICYKN
ncbi:MAG: phosphatidylglycerol lysyltransferase domain-containing protein [Firmicutes bacterium]|nr:phosphatidylglycerol lysyltransferase domain-containing protein [Bacillota bacterium]